MSDKKIARLQAKIRALQKQLDAKRKELGKPTAGPSATGRLGAVLAFASGRFDEALRIASRRSDKGLYNHMKAFVKAYRVGLAAYDKREFDTAAPELLRAMQLTRPLGGLAMKHVPRIRKLAAICYFYKGTLAMSGLQYAQAFAYFTTAKRFAPELRSLASKFAQLEQIARSKMKIAMKNPNEHTSDGRSICKLQLIGAARLVPKGSELHKQLRKAEAQCQ